MRVVLDTNILITILSRRSKYSDILDFFVDEAFTLCVTTEILNEYAEIIERFMGVEHVDYFMEIIDQAKNIEYVTTYYRWKLITNDPDDDEFVDCAIACNAKYLVTEDKHFKILAKTPYPKVETIGIEAFANELREQ